MGSILSTKLPTDKMAKLVESIKAFSQSNFGGSEANTKRKIIEPLLEMLRWDLLSNEVQLEYPIHVGTSSVYVDYAIFLEGKPVILVEAKPFDSSLSADYASQIISYGRVEDIRWAALTNGKMVKIFDTKAGRNEKDCLVAEIDLQNLPSNSVELSLISRESILTGEIESAAKRLATTRKAVNSLTQRKDELAQEFKKVLLKITGPEIEDRIESISKKLADLALQSFEKESEPSQQPLDRTVRIVARSELATKSPGAVVLCPSKSEGVEFLKKYNAWGFVNMNKQVPYFALYVGSPESSVLYFGEVESITKPITSKEDIQRIEEKDIESFPSGKRAIHLKPRTLVKLADPIPLKNKRIAPRGIRYTTLEKLINANYAEEL
jgi:predicted type IV restriction endonuclease